MPDKVLYTAEATSTGDGRSGHVVSSDHRLDFDLARPAEMGGDGNGTNPEQLFAAGYSACFHSALRIVARRAKVDPGDSTVTPQVGIGPDGDAFGLVVTLIIHLPRPGPRPVRRSPRRPAPHRDLGDAGEVGRAPRQPRGGRRGVHGGKRHLALLPRPRRRPPGTARRPPRRNVRQPRPLTLPRKC